jgi:hypothetical protein
MAAIGVSLWKYVMRYAPHTPTYFNRDRFVLSNGTLLGCTSCYYGGTDQGKATLACSSTPSCTLLATGL